jgi:hypothetical protein
MRLLFWVLGVGLAGVALAAEPAPPKFVAKPTATKAADGKVKIDFATDRETDVAVFVEDGGGKVVRHLVAGVLGKNPPPPLKPGLAQSVEWDGRADYGKPALGGPFKVRVALGLGAKYDKVLIEDTLSLGNVRGLGVGPDGTVYVVGYAGGGSFGSEVILAINRDGTYQRTIAPFPSSLSRDRAKGFQGIELDGRPAPLAYNENDGLYPPVSPMGERKTVMAVSKEGYVYRVIGGARYQPPAGIAAVDSEGGCPAEQYLGPPLLPAGHIMQLRPCLSISSDGKAIFITGLRDKFYLGTPGEKALTAVYRAKLPERGPAEPFFGDPNKEGKDQSHLGGVPHGTCPDGKGNLLIADCDGDRIVVVAEKDGKYVGEFAVTKPDCVAVDPQTGAVYVTKIAGKWPQVELIKFSGWQNPKELAKFTPTGEVGFQPWLMVVDFSAKPGVVWMGSDNGRLLRIEDSGGKFETPREVSSGSGGLYDNPTGCSLDMSVDRFREDREIYVRSNGDVWFRYNEKTDKISSLNFMRTAGLRAGGGGGKGYLAGPDGNIYGIGYSWQLFKLNREGKPLTWDKPFYPDTADRPEFGGATGWMADPLKKKDPHYVFVPVSENDTTHTLGLRHDGHIFVFAQKGPGARTSKALWEFLPTGEKVVDPIIWKVSDWDSGPRFDPQGNIYISSPVRPAGWNCPPELQTRLEGPLGKGSFGPGPYAVARGMYGSIVKFSPKGGMIQYPDAANDPRPYDGEPKLDPGLKSIDAEMIQWGAGSALAKVKVTGAEWIHPGYSRLASNATSGCNCESSRFDVDEFGRVWFPDLNLFQVRVIDTNGNALAKFGGYGNADSRGPDSAVIDPQTKKLRPRRAEDPKDLKSPFAQPEIAFSWLVGVVATDKYVYAGDLMNRRMLRLKQVYAAEETCPIQ